MANLLSNGISQGDLVDLLVSIKTKWNAVMVKLDADATLADDDYVSANSLTIPSGIQTDGVKAVRDQGQIVTFCQDMITQWNLVMAKLDADTLAGLDDDYASTLGLTDVVGVDAVDAILNTGVTQGALINFLNRWIVNWNLLLAKMDTDPLAASDYASSNGMTDTVEEAGSYARMKSIIIFFLISLGLSGSVQATDLNGSMFSSPALCVSTAPYMPTNDLDRYSLQVVWSSATASNVSFTDGTKGTLSITVGSNFALLGTTSTITINGTVLSSSHYTIGASTAATATSIAAAINAHTDLNTIIVATAPASCATFPLRCGIVTATTTAPSGTQYSVTTSSWPVLTPSAPYFTGGIDSNVASDTDIITKTNSYEIGQGVSLSTTTNVALSGLTWGTTYFIIPAVKGTSFKLATTAANAVSGTAIDISTSSAGGGAFVLTPSSTTTGASFILQVSNNGTNWITAPSTSTVTIGDASGVTSAIYDAGAFNYKFIRLNYTAPTRGGITLDTSVSGFRRR